MCFSKDLSKRLILCVTACVGSLRDRWKDGGYEYPGKRGYKRLGAFADLLKSGSKKMCAPAHRMKGLLFSLKLGFERAVRKRLLKWKSLISNFQVGDHLKRLYYFDCYCHSYVLWAYRMAESTNLSLKVCCSCHHNREICDETNEFLLAWFQICLCSIALITTISWLYITNRSGTRFPLRPEQRLTHFKWHKHNVVLCAKLYTDPLIFSFSF